MAQALQSLLLRPDGQRRLGPFHLKSPLGKGGSAPVWLADEIYGDAVLRTAAVKVFPLAEIGEAAGSTGSNRSSSTSASERRSQIVEEVRALCRVEHPNVVRFYALHTDEELGLVGIAMEFVDGTPLDAKLQAADGAPRPLGIEDAVEVGLAVASALSVVHQAGLVHRDVKPSNVIESRGVYKLIDFGIAAFEQAQSRKLRSPREILMGDVPIAGMPESDDAPTALHPQVSGTRGYVDPVCIATGAGATAASDLYGLGASLYECLCGYVPAVAATRKKGEGGHDPAVVFGKEAPPPIRSLRSDAPESIARLIDSLVAPSREDRPRSADQVARELERIRGQLAGHSVHLPPEEEGPFRGLGRFEERDRDVYFGRSAEVAAALQLLRTRGLVALIGASGSGKSSLARAGVLPAVLDGALGRWPKAWDKIVVTPGSDPFASMTAALEPIVTVSAPYSVERIVGVIVDHVERTGRGLVLLVDQLEELVTLHRGDDASGREAVVELLTRLSERAPLGIRTLVAVRRDLLDPLLALSDAFGRALTRGSLLVSPMGDAAWAEVLEQALEAYGYRFEDEDLRRSILAELRGKISAMPLVQFALTQLWARRDKERKMVTRAGFEAIGGIRGALEQHADATLRKLARQDEDQDASHAIRKLLIALTTPQGTRAFREVEALREEVENPRVDALLERLERARLVVREAEGYTLAHESLLTEWGTLRTWLTGAREDRMLAVELEEGAKKWRDGHDPTLLWRKRRLFAAEELERHGSVRLSDSAREFVKASRFEERKGRFVAAGLAAALAVGAAVVGAGYLAKARAAAHNEQQARALAEGRERDANQLASAKAALLQQADDEKKRESEMKSWYQSELSKLQKDVSALQKQADELQGTKDPERIKALVKAVSNLQSGSKGMTDAGPKDAAESTPKATVAGPTVVIPPPE